MYNSTLNSKKEIRLNLSPKLYSFLSRNANVYGIKANEYIVHLILDDIRDNTSIQIPYLSDESEIILEEGYQEIKDLKKKGKLTSYNSKELIKQIF